MSTDNAPLSQPKMDMSNPEHNQIEVPHVQEASAKSAPMATSAAMGKQQPIEQPMGDGTTDAAARQKASERTPEQLGYPVQHADPEKDNQAAILKADKLSAMQKGP